MLWLQSRASLRSLCQSASMSFIPTSLLKFLSHKKGNKTNKQTNTVKKKKKETHLCDPQNTLYETICVSGMFVVTSMSTTRNIGLYISGSQIQLAIFTTVITFNRSTPSIRHSTSHRCPELKCIRKQQSKKGRRKKKVICNTKVTLLSICTWIQVLWSWSVINSWSIINSWHFLHLLI